VSSSGGPAQPAFEDERVDIERLGEVVRDVGDVAERVVPEGEFPVDEPQPLSVEQDVAWVAVVVGGNLGRGAGVLGAHAGEACNMGVEDAGCEQSANAYEIEQRVDERPEILRDPGERSRRLQSGDHLAERVEKGWLAAGECGRRTFDHEVHQHHARLRVGIVHGRRDAGLCCSAKTREAALGVLKAAPARFDPQQVGARANVDPERRGARRTGCRRTDPGDRRRVSDRRDGGECHCSPIVCDRLRSRRTRHPSDDRLLDGGAPRSHCMGFRRRQHTTCRAGKLSEDGLRANTGVT
jgi:hypothetical protein